MSENLDLFGGHAIDEIPEGYNLEARKEPYEVVIEKAEVVKSKNTGSYGIAITYKDIEEGGFGLTAFQWLGIPAPANRAQFLLRDLKALTLTNEQILVIAKSVNGTPQDAEVEIEPINDVLSDIVGVEGYCTISEYVNKRDGSTGTNVSFKPGMKSDHDDSPVATTPATSESKVETADTSEWFND